jgi:hypothetical protein
VDGDDFKVVITATAPENATRKLEDIVDYKLHAITSMGSERVMMLQVVSNI